MNLRDTLMEGSNPILHIFEDFEPKKIERGVFYQAIIALEVKIVELRYLHGDVSLIKEEGTTKARYISNTRIFNTLENATKKALNRINKTIPHGENI